MRGCFYEQRSHHERTLGPTTLDQCLRPVLPAISIGKLKTFEIVGKIARETIDSREPLLELDENPAENWKRGRRTKNERATRERRGEIQGPLDISRKRALST